MVCTPHSLYNNYVNSSTFSKHVTLFHLSSPWPIYKKFFIAFSANSFQPLKLSSKVIPLGSSLNTPSSPLLISPSTSVFCSIWHTFLLAASICEHIYLSHYIVGYPRIEFIPFLCLYSEYLAWFLADRGILDMFAES